MSDRADSNFTGKLLAEGFARTGPVATALSDPIADTPMLLTLDQLAPYELDPRMTRNPKYDEIKASIRERGLDSPPTVTRRPGGEKYIIRNGGNTRLAILRELWTETRGERFYRISCLFKPWRNEITALTGHLSENELRGGLTFIERALGVDKARELYEAEDGKALGQRELARRLAADGFAVPRPHISRMQDTVLYLLPAIPNALYGGLGRPQIEKLTTLRNAAQRMWDQRSGSLPGEDFQTCFHEVLAGFDGPAASFSFQRVQDELIGRMAETFDADYDSLVLALSDVTQMQELINVAPSTSSADLSAPGEGSEDESPDSLPNATVALGNEAPAKKSRQTASENAIATQPRPVASQGLPSRSLDAQSPREDDGRAAKAPDDLRLQAFQLAQGLASAFGRPDAVKKVHSGFGFSLQFDSTDLDIAASDATMFILLSCLGNAGTGTPPQPHVSKQIDGAKLAGLLLEQTASSAQVHHLRDEHLNELFDLIWLLRQLRCQDATRVSDGAPTE